MKSSRLLVLCALVACSTDVIPQEPGLTDLPPLDESKIDGETISLNELRGVLSFVNDPDVTLVDLDALLDRRAAEGVMSERPILSLEDLDAVPYVGPVAFAALEREACDGRGLCEPPIDLLSWNIENFPNTERTAPAVTELMGELAPTVVGFQEILDREAFAELIDGLPNYEGFVGVQHGRDTGVAFAYRTDRVYIEHVQSLFIDDNWAFPRPPMAVTFSLTGRAGHGLFTVLVVHLKARGDDRSVQRRRDAMERIDAWVAGHSAETTPNVFVLGDFNDHLMDDEGDDVFVPFRGDEYEILTMPLAENGDYSYIPAFFRGLIDHVVVTDDAARNFPALHIEAVEAESMVAGYVDSVSDHRPVRSRHIPILPAWR